MKSKANWKRTAGICFAIVFFFVFAAGGGPKTISDLYAYSASGSYQTVENHRVFLFSGNDWRSLPAYNYRHSFLHYLISGDR